MTHERRPWLLPSALVVFAILYSNAPRAIAPPDIADLLHTHRLLHAGYQGQGVRVGVISGGAVNYGSLVEQHILPEPLQRFGRHSEEGDEGDWMMQVVHQIAPRALLAFCPASEPAQTVDCARELIEHFHADIVVDDLNPLPVYEFPTPKARGLGQLSREHPQVLFFTGAGNNAGGYYEGRWTPTPLILGGTRHLAQDFGRSVGEDSDPYQTIVLPESSGATVLLGRSGTSQCDRTHPQVSLTFVDSDGAVLASATSRCPVLSLTYRNSEASPRRLRIVVLLPADTQPESLALKLVAIRQEEGVVPVTLSYRTGGGAGNSATAAGLIAVGAVNPNSGWHGRYLYEPFSNSGPQCLQVGGPHCFQQPAFVVPDGLSVRVPGPDQDRYTPFVGNSAAGPAAAAVAALLRSADIAPERITELLERTALAQTDSGSWDPHYGYGLLNADAAAGAAGVIAVVKPSDTHDRPVAAQSRQLTLRAMHAHDTGDDAEAARWAFAAAEACDPAGQSFLGSMFNRGWGVPQDPRAAQSWWWRAAQAGVNGAMFNLGTTVARGRGAPADPVLGYALMRAAGMRGLQFQPLDAANTEFRSSLNAQQIHKADIQAARFAADPTTVPLP